MLHVRTKTSTEKIAFARNIRSDGNPAEKLLWSKLRRKQFFGLRFRRQVPFGPYVLDFLCVKKDFVIEIDGHSHDDTQEKDAKRDAFLRQKGLTILHIGHKETLNNIDGILERIRLVLRIEYD
ncbi:hypothetical protein A3D11_02260 [Candidatus Peribacteria bacterium RIFCSPHIGHO2_02_FULL_49_16]|nr:MAG: hypothetical protein A2880_03720 [Candidatus Peribacteria bacterium RIFCSPHIGHO2_01_FULL_49_38]OGJ59949.1 MAG: hypothetical protein A3D11_02260 [Candidatus Peribacteria bacterium RIFCSPHIGHO2_02_FULL_49_16]